MEKLKVTSLQEIKERTAQKVVELPGFGEDDVFAAKLRRVSLLELAQNETIPNELLGAVNDLYSKGVGGIRNLKDTARTLTFVARQSLVEPSYQELEEAQLQLTDAQLLSIYLYSVGGAQALRGFR